jgi:hypothetical protein
MDARRRIAAADRPHGHSDHHDRLEVVRRKHAVKHGSVAHHGGAKQQCVSRCATPASDPKVAFEIDMEGECDRPALTWTEERVLS